MNRGIETAVRIPLDTPGQSKLLRGVIAVIGIAAWFFTQSLLASQGFPQGIDDRLHILLSPLTQWLAHHDNPANLLLIVTSAVIDALGQMIWRDPGFPSLLVTYQTGNDFFFSGHTAIAVYGAAELSRSKRPWIKVVAILIATIEAVTVLILRAHYTMDVLTAVLAALCVSSLVARLAQACDRKLAAWSMRSSIV
jgi:PAP2 superfamily C-terminal